MFDISQLSDAHKNNVNKDGDLVGGYVILNCEVNYSHICRLLFALNLNTF